MSPEPDYKNNPMTGPFLNALICEKILEEKDGLKSAIRILDQLNRAVVGPNVTSAMEPFPYPISMLVRLKAGAARGIVQINVRILKPNNESAGELNHPVHLPGPEDAGFDIVLNVMMTVDQVGTWWFDIYVDDERWMRIPLRVVYFPRQVK